MSKVKGDTSERNNDFVVYDCSKVEIKGFNFGNYWVQDGIFNHKAAARIISLFDILFLMHCPYEH